MLGHVLDAQEAAAAARAVDELQPRYGHVLAARREWPRARRWLVLREFEASVPGRGEEQWRGIAIVAWLLWDGPIATSHQVQLHDLPPSNHESLLLNSAADMALSIAASIFMPVV